MHEHNCFNTLLTLLVTVDVDDFIQENGQSIVPEMTAKTSNNKSAKIIIMQRATSVAPDQPAHLQCPVRSFPVQ